MPFKDQIQWIAVKLNSKQGLPAGARQYVNIDYSKILSNTLVLPHFDYNSQSWYNSAMIQLDILIKLCERPSRLLL